MPVNCIVTLAMVDDHHFAVAGKSIGVDHRALFHRADFLADRCVDIDAVAKYFGGEFRVLVFAEGCADLAAHRPVEPAAERLEPGAGGGRWRGLLLWLVERPAS